MLNPKPLALLAASWRLGGKNLRLQTARRGDFRSARLSAWRPELRASERGGAECNFTFFSVDQNFKLYDTGFRCCFTADPRI